MNKNSRAGMTAPGLDSLFILLLPRFFTYVDFKRDLHKGRYNPMNFQFPRSQQPSKAVACVLTAQHSY